MAVGTLTLRHGSLFMVRPRPFIRAHKREASGVISGTNYSPKVCLIKLIERIRMRERASVNSLFTRQNRTVQACIR